jgi:GLPGLI family protein
MKIIKLFMLILFFFFNIIGYAQQNNFEATYKINYAPMNYDSILNNSNGKSERFLQMVKKDALETKSSIKELEKINFILEYNNNESIFYQEKTIFINERSMQKLFPLLSISDDREVFTNKVKIYKKLNAYGQDFLLEMPKIKWEITNIQKKIGKFNCYKAVAKIERENSKRKFIQKIEAWFTPEIAFNYGPQEYNGLPGLIIEIKIGKNVMYHLTEIRTIKYKKIEMPTVGKKIIWEDFNALGKKMYENRKN